MPAKWSRHVFSFRFYEGKINCAPHLRAALRRADTQKLSHCGGTAQGRLSDLPNADPTGRVEEMEKRLDATLSAVKTMQPAFARFYDSMSDGRRRALIRCVRRPGRRAAWMPRRPLKFNPVRVTDRQRRRDR